LKIIDVLTVIVNKVYVLVLIVWVWNNESDY